MKNRADSKQITSRLYDHISFIRTTAADRDMPTKSHSNQGAASLPQVLCIWQTLKSLNIKRVQRSEGQARATRLFLHELMHTMTGADWCTPAAEQSNEP